jgi:hypothetical protein
MIYLVDIDQTCADPTDRFKIAGPMPDRKDRAAFQQWLDHAHNPEMLHLDKPVVAVREIVKGLDGLDRVKIFYLTGRSEAQRAATEKWLLDNGFPTAPVLMRENDDWRGPHRYKSAHLKMLQAKFPNEKFVAIDDDYAGDCKAMYLNRGVTFLKVVTGEEDVNEQEKQT